MTSELEPLLSEQERKLSKQRLFDLEAHRRETDTTLLEDIGGISMWGLEQLGSGVKGAATAAIDVLTLPDEFGLTALELGYQAREKVGLGSIVPESAKTKEMRAKSQANIEAIAGIRSLADLRVVVGGMIERGQARPWDEQVMGALMTVGATAAGKQILKRLGLVDDPALLKEFLKQIPEESVPTTVADDLVSENMDRFPRGGNLIPDAGDVIPSGSKSQFLPTGVGTEVIPTSLMENVIGMPRIYTGLTKREEAENAVLWLFGRLDNNPIGNAPFHVRKQVQPAIDNTASTLGLKHDASIRGVFEIDQAGRVRGFSGVDPTVPGDPTIADIAARLPLYWDVMSPAQRKAMDGLREALAPYRELLDQVGLLEDIGTRTDIVDGGFYIPRGRPDREGADVARTGGARVTQFVRGLGSAGKTARWPSQAEGIENGDVYSALGEVLTSHVRHVGNAAVDTHIATYFKQLVDPVTQELLGQSAKVRLLKQNPQLVSIHDSLRQDVANITSLVSNLDARVRKVLDDFLDPSIPFDDIEAFKNAIRDVSVVQRGLREGATRPELVDAKTRALQKLKDIAPQWKAALEKARDDIPIGQNRIIGSGGFEFPGLQGLTFPDEVASAATRMLKGDPTWIKAIDTVVGPANNLYRAFRATMDFSAMGIQGLLGLHSAPKSYGDALRLMFRSVGDEQSLGKYINQFDETAVTSGRAGSDIWARAGLRMGAANTEFALGKDVVILKQANRAYGFFGDTLRLGWADELLQQELAKGRKLQEIIGSGDLEKLANIANNMTGWSKGKTFGSVGDLGFFAPRFLNSRLTTLTKAMTDGGIEGIAARRSMIRMIGFGVLETVALNEALGNETDFRPIVNGKPNANFMRVRALGRDWSLFGTWDSLARAIILSAGGDPQDALRGMGSGVVANAWNFISGRTFMGEEVPKILPWQEGELDPVELGKFLIVENFVPFAAEEAGQSIQQVVSGVTQGDVGEFVEGTAAIFGEMSGVKSSTTSASENRDIARQQEMLERVAAGLPEDMEEHDKEAMIAGDFDSLSDDIKGDIDATPRVAEKTGLLMDSRRNRGSKWQLYVDERTKFESWSKHGRVTESGAEPGIYDLVDRFARSKGGLLKEGEDPLFGRMFRSQLSKIQGVLRRRKRDLRESDEGKEALAFIEELDPSKNEFNIALDEYYTAVADPYLEDFVSGTYDFEERERRLQVMREKHGDLTMDRIERFVEKNDNAVVKKLRRDQETMAPYFALLEEKIAEYEQGPDTAKQFAGLADLYEEFRLLDPALQPIEIDKPYFSKLEAIFWLVNDRREAVEGFTETYSYRQRWLMGVEDPDSPPTREERQEIDRLLVYWGYRDSAATDVVKLELYELAEERETQPTGLRDLSIQPRDFTSEEREEMRRLVEESGYVWRQYPGALK